MTALAVLLLVLGLASWSKLSHADQNLKTEGVTVVLGNQALSANNTLTNKATTLAPVNTVTALTAREDSIRQFAYKALSFRSRGPAEQQAYGTPHQRPRLLPTMSREDFDRRVHVACTDHNCMMTAQPGDDPTMSRQIVAMLVTVEAGLLNNDLKGTGFRPGHIKAELVDGVRTVKLPFIRSNN